MLEQELKTTFTDKQWEDISANTFRITISTKLREFQSWAVKGTLKTNIQLSKWNIKSNTLYTTRRLPLVLHSSCTVGSTYLGSIECGDCIHLREA